MNRKNLIITSLLILMVILGSKVLAIETLEEVREVEDLAGDEILEISKDSKEAIKKINRLNEKYDSGYNLIQPNIGEGNYNSSIEYANIDFTNNMNKEYYDEFIKILDTTVAKGLEKYLEEMNNKTLELDDPILNKIGRATVLIEDRHDPKKYVYIYVDLLDVKDDSYKQLYDKISDQKYILENGYTGGEFDLIDFSNKARGINIYLKRHNGIRYNLFLKDKKIHKVNILIENYGALQPEKDDIDVFNNLMDTLNLDEDDKNSLLEEYTNLFKDKVKDKKIKNDNYDLLVKGNKGNKHIGEKNRLIYFSLDLK